MAEILSIDKGGLARRKGLKVGDDILYFNDMPMNDILDYLYADGQGEFDITFLRHGKQKVKHIVKDEALSLGLNFSKKYDLCTTRCKNKCKFCFIDQLPKNKDLRETLFVKDDDYRLSFACGNYVTLTNVTDKDIDRIIKYHLSPMYISVHAFDTKIRTMLVSNPNTRNLINYIKRMADAGIVMHTQIVMCKGINDGDILEQTCRELLKFYPNVKTLAVVPVGLSDHREGLYPLEKITKEVAIDSINRIEKINKEVGGFCWCSDEMYLLAEKEIPDVSYYGDLDQIGNGVGLLADFRADFQYKLDEIKGLTTTKSFAFITGKSFSPILKNYAKTLEYYIKGINIEVFPIENTFFGKNITVAGLVVGTDIINQIKDKIDNIDYVVLPKTMFKEFETVMLDGTTIDELVDKLGKQILICEPTASGLIDEIRSVL